jgi:hypothetical protein
MTTGQLCSRDKQRRLRENMTDAQKEDLKARNLIARQKHYANKKALNTKK